MQRNPKYESSKEYLAWLELSNRYVDIDVKLNNARQVAREHERMLKTVAPVYLKAPDAKAYKAARDLIRELETVEQQITTLRHAFEATPMGRVFLLEETINALVADMEASWATCNSVPGMRGNFPPHWRTNETKLANLRKERDKLMGIAVAAAPETTVNARPTSMPDLSEKPLRKAPASIEDREWDRESQQTGVRMRK